MITIGPAKGEDPDAAASLRKALAVLELLEVVDASCWDLPRHLRYQWTITRASKNSPLELVASGRKRVLDHPPSDVVHQFFVMMADIETGNPFRIPEHRQADAIRALKELIPRRGQPTIAVSIPGGKARYSPSRMLETRIKELRRSDPVADEYEVIEGLLRTVTADPRPDKGKYVIEVVDRDSQEAIRCSFPESAKEIIGKHVGNAIMVEGLRSPGGVLHVEDFRLIPKESSPLGRLRGRLHLPDGIPDSLTFVRRIRGLEDPEGDDDE